MAIVPNCISCNLDRTLVSVQPTRNRHDVHQYECPSCKSAFRLVAQRTQHEADDIVVGFPALQASAG
jgi:transposase-like protein